MKGVLQTVLRINLLLFTNYNFSQELERDEVDEFTKSKVKETSWELFTNY